MRDNQLFFDEILRIELEEAEWDFSSTKSFADAVATAKQEITKSFEEALAAADGHRVAVKMKEPQPA